MKIDISDLPLERVIFSACKNVFDSSKAIIQKERFTENVVFNSPLMLGGTVSLPSIQQIKTILKNTTYITHIGGIALELDLSNPNEIDFSEYDKIHETGKNDILTSLELINGIRHEVCVNYINELLPIYFQKECYLVELKNGGLAIRMQGLVDGMAVKKQLEKLNIQIDLFETIKEKSESILKNPPKEFIQISLSRVSLFEFESSLRSHINLMKIGGCDLKY